MGQDAENLVISLLNEFDQDPDFMYQVWDNRGTADGLRRELGAKGLDDPELVDHLSNEDVWEALARLRDALGGPHVEIN